MAEVPPPPFVTVRLTDGQVLRGRIKVDVGLAFGSGSSVPLPWLDLTYNLR